MPSRSELNRLSAAKAQLIRAAQRELAAFMALLPDDPVRARAELLEFFPVLVNAYGEAGVAVAAEWFESTAPSAMSARVALGDPIPEAQAVGSAKWAARVWEEQGASGVSALLRGPMQRLILNPSRQTIRRSAARSRVGYARVPSGVKTCAFCLMLASRGAVYESEESATRTSSGDDYHDDCYCEATPVWERDDLPAGYDPDALYGQYQAAAAQVGNTWDTKAILAALRDMQGIA